MAPLGRLDHRRDRVLRDQEHGLDIDLHDAAPGLRFLVDHAATAADADIVIEEIEPAKPVDSGFDQLFALGFTRGIGGVRRGRATSSAII